MVSLELYAQMVGQHVVVRGYISLVVFVVFLVVGVTVGLGGPSLGRYWHF